MQPIPIKTHTFWTKDGYECSKNRRASKQNSRKRIILSSLKIYTRTNISNKFKLKSNLANGFYYQNSHHWCHH